MRLLGWKPPTVVREHGSHPKAQISVQNRSVLFCCFSLLHSEADNFLDLPQKTPQKFSEAPKTSWTCKPINTWYCTMTKFLCCLQKTLEKKTAGLLRHGPIAAGVFFFMMGILRMSPFFLRESWHGTVGLASSPLKTRFTLASKRHVQPNGSTSHLKAGG